MPGLGELLILTVFAGLLGVWIWMIVDCAVHEPPLSRTSWLLIVILLGMLGALIYLIARRGKNRMA